MNRLKPEKLHTRFAPGTRSDGPVVPRRYTMTHYDTTGDLFLTVGSDYDHKQISGWHTRFMRDEVLAEWLREKEQDRPALHVHCHVSGGLIAGLAGWRDAIFRRELPLALEVFRFGDRAFFEAHPELDHSPLLVHFHATQSRYDRVEQWGVPADYCYRGE